MVIIALSISIAVMVSIPTGVIVKQKAKQNLSENYIKTITNIQEEINETSALIEIRASGGSPFMPSGTPQSGLDQRGATSLMRPLLTKFVPSEGIKDLVPFIEVPSEEVSNKTINTPRGSFTISRSLYTILGVPLSAC